jgi:hypothetical protein
MTALANSPVFWIGLLAGLAGLYVLPSMIALIRHIEDTALVVILNCFPIAPLRNGSCPSLAASTEGGGRSCVPHPSHVFTSPLGVCPEPSERLASGRVGGPPQTYRARHAGRARAVPVGWFGRWASPASRRRT